MREEYEEKSYADQDCAKGSVSEAERTGHIPQSIDQLQSKVEMLALVIDKLEKKLQPVINSVPRNEKEKSDELLLGSKTAEQIYRIGRYVEIQAFRIKDIIETVDL